MKHTVVALFDKAETAQKAANSLETRGFDPSAVHVTQGGMSVDPEVPPASEIEGGPLSGLLHRLSWMFGVKEPHLAHYAEAVRQGDIVVQVDAGDEAQAAVARDTLLAMGALDIDDRVEEWQRAGWRSPVAGAEAADSSSAGAGPGAVVHRQDVSLGGVRVYGHLVVAAFDDLADEFRADFETRYAPQGAPYEDFDPAYRYGHALASDIRHDRRHWNEIEPQARIEWERRHPQSPWERFRNAVQFAWERATGH